MQKQIVEAGLDDAVSVHVVWMPMVPGDSEEAAQAIGRMFAGKRVHQYYDRERTVGRAYVRDVFPTCIAEALRATPEDHPLHDTLAEWAGRKGDTSPLWDAVLFYPPSIQWAERTPSPSLWSKQVGFVPSRADGTTGVFFHNDCKQPPVDSDWHREVRSLISQLRDGASTTKSDAVEPPAPAITTRHGALAKVGFADF